MRPFDLIVLCAATLLVWSAPSRAQGPAAGSPPQPGVSADGRIGFKTVAEALETLKALPGAQVSVTQPDSWVIISEPGGMVVWAFTPPPHPAHPAVVRRAVVVGSDKMARLQMTALCQADKASCDKLMEEFRELNDRAARAVQERVRDGRKK